MKTRSIREYTSLFYRKNRGAFFFALLATVLNTLAGFGITLVLQEMLDTAVGVPGARTPGALLWEAGGLLLFYILVKVMLSLSQPRFLRRAMTQYKEGVFRKLTEKSAAAFSREPTSRYLSAFSNDMNTIETSYLEAQFLLLRNFIEMTGALCMMLWYNPLMTAIAIGFLVLPTLAAALQGSRLEAAEQKVSRKNARLLGLLRDCLNGFSVLRSFGAQGRMAGLMGGRIREAEGAKCRRRQIVTVLDAIGGITALVAQLGTFLAGVLLILGGRNMTPGVLVAFMDLTATFIDPVGELPGYLGSRRAARGLIAALRDHLEENVPVPGAGAPAALAQALQLEQVSFAYEPEEGAEAPRPVLRNFSYTFRAGGCYAIVGASGSGKSTLLSLLAGGRDYEGRILYDGTEQRSLSPDSLRDTVSEIQQNVFLFNASIEENITLFRDFPAREVDRAIDLAGLRPLVEARGAGSLCGEDGCSLSGGEKQRISIARSLLKQARLLLADEATAALDRETAHQVTTALLGLKGMTRLVVTHALDAPLLRRYDAILAMKDGALVETGTFDALMEQKGYFYSLYTLSQ